MNRIHYHNEHPEDATPEQMESLNRYLKKYKVGEVGGKTVVIKCWKPFSFNEIIQCKIQWLDYYFNGDGFVNQCPGYLFAFNADKETWRSMAEEKIKLLQKEYEVMTGLNFRMMTPGSYYIEFNDYSLYVFRRENRYKGKPDIDIRFYKEMKTLNSTAWISKPENIQETPCHVFLKDFIRNRFSLEQVMVLPSIIRDWLNVDFVENKGDSHEPVHQSTSGYN